MNSKLLDFIIDQIYINHLLTLYKNTALRAYFVTIFHLFVKNFELYMKNQGYHFFVAFFDVFCTVDYFWPVDAK